ncbi:MAG TPA: TonB family protein [Thermoanaerobaculia bacterium]|nr:TonB family protein [Thermoanaerobaculia bacterium]
MSAQDPLPRRFGTYLLTAFLTEDVLGQVFRAVRTSGDRGFVRLRLFESPEISEDSVVDAIEENGEIHTFLKNPAIARGVQLDAVEGLPFLAWNEPNGRTLDALITRARERGQGIPIEHALLIVEKIATALDHAYNTTVDGERTLHGLVWPGFVSVSDDGETRLTGFGLASGFFPSLGRPRFQSEVAPYLAPEERANQAVGKNSDVFSVGVILFELLFGRLPSASDPSGDLKGVSLEGGAVPPEVAAVLRTCLAPAESRYQSSGELRRELGKILFSGPYSPSTFNLAFFLSGLFGPEIEAENQARARETGLEAGGPQENPLPGSAFAAPSSAPRSLRPPAAPPPRARRAPYAIGGAVLVAAALAGTAYVILRRPLREGPRGATRVTSLPSPAAAKTPEPTSPPTAAMSEAQFKEEVARRVASELKKLQEQAQKSGSPGPPGGRSARPAPAEPPPEISANKEAPQEAVPPTAPPRADPTAPPTAAPTAVAETRIAPSEAPAEVEIPSKILRVVKPTYPALALRARIRGIVLLRVLVSETGIPEQIEVLRGAGGGLTESAVVAVRKWTFEPARRNGQPVKSWTTVPIPFEP